MKETVFITGAGGFLGGWFAEALYLQGRHEVVAGLNSWSSAARIARFPINFVQANLLDSEAIDQALEGVDVVVHCAFMPDNDRSAQATRNLFEAVRRRGVRKVVHISSAAVYGDVSGSVSEDTPARPPFNEYMLGKQQTEQIASEFASPDTRVSVLRPTIIYGPFSTSWTLPVINRLVSGGWRHLGALGEGKANLVYAGDVVRLAEFVLANQQTSFEVYNSNGPDIPTWNEYYRLMSTAMGLGEIRHETRNLSLQVAMRRPIRMIGKYVLANHRELLMAASARSHVLIDILRKVEEDLRLKPNDSEMALFNGNAVFSNDKAKAMGFVPPTRLQRGVAYSAEWARAIGLM